jgi:hypothetical protein
LALLALLAVFSPARPARADGGLPQSYGILLAADRPAEVALATNFGLLISEDAGQSWLWTCEQGATAMGYQYGLGPAPADRLYALSPTEGLSLSDDGSCSWQRAGGALDAAVASDYFVDRNDAHRVLAVAAGRGTDGGVLPQSVYLSSDGGTTFGTTALYTAPAMTNVVGIEIARSDPSVVYIAMYAYSNALGFHPTLLRSGDGGASWTPRDVEAGVGAHEFRILAVEPDDPDLLYLRVISAGQEILAVTRDAGATFSTPLQVPNGTLSAFARLASGTVLVAGLVSADGGTTTGGVAWRSADGGATFDAWTLSPQPRLRALAERGGTLYLAGDNYQDGWALARSSDEGRTVQPIARYDQVSSVKACVAAVCQASCDDQAGRRIWGPEVCNPSARDAGLDGGRPVAASSGCGCSAGGPRGGIGIGLAGLCGALAMAVARRSAARRRRP